MSDDPNTGPSRHTLKELAKMLPTLAKGLKDGTVGGKGRKIFQPGMQLHARKTCKICCTLFDMVKLGPGAEVTPQPGICNRCQDLLDRGFIAFTCSTGPSGRGRFCFGKAASLKDKAGTIMPINVEVFDKLEAHFKAEWEKHPDGNDPTKDPPQQAG